MCFSNDGDGTQLSSEVVTARKPHRCDECVETIPPRTRYRRHVAVCDGYLTTLKFCLGCDSLHRAIHEHELGEGCAWDESWCPVGETRDYLRDSGLTFDGARLVSA